MSTVNEIVKIGKTYTTTSNERLFPCDSNGKKNWAIKTVLPAGTLIKYEKDHAEYEGIGIFIVIAGPLEGQRFLINPTAYAFFQEE